MTWWQLLVLIVGSALGIGSAVGIVVLAMNYSSNESWIIYRNNRDEIKLELLKERNRLRTMELQHMLGVMTKPKEGESKWS